LGHRSTNAPKETCLIELIPALAALVVVLTPWGVLTMTPLNHFAPPAAAGEPSRRPLGRTVRAVPSPFNTHTPVQSTHSEKLGPETLRRLSRERGLAFHTRFLREAVRSSPLVEVVRDIEDVRSSLRFVAENGAGAGGRTARAVAEVFSRTDDEEAKRLCLLGLKVIGSKAARAELLRMYHGEGVDDRWQALIAEYLSSPAAKAPGASSVAPAGTR
jgi:hypothetical protein